jgi:hypothetical protein
MTQSYKIGAILIGFILALLLYIYIINKYDKKELDIEDNIEKKLDYVANYYKLLMFFLFIGICGGLLWNYKTLSDDNRVHEAFVSKLFVFFSTLLSLPDTELDKIISVFSNVVICIFLYVFIFKFIINNN